VIGEDEPTRISRPNSPVPTIGHVEFLFDAGLR
jgi:hypothetical protein